MIPSRSFHVFPMRSSVKNRTDCNPGGMQSVDLVWGAWQQDGNRPAAVLRDLEGVAYPGVDPVVG